MEKNIEKAIDNFIDNPEIEKKVNVSSRGKAVRIIDSTLITEDGRQLLREHN